MIIQNHIQKSILKHLEKGPDTKSNLASLFDVSITAITSHINELKDLGFILEKDSTLHTGGRIPKILELNTKGKFSLGIGFSNKLVRVVLMSIGKEIIDEERHVEQFSSFEDYLKQSKTMIDSILKRNKLDNTNIIGAGISIPGPVDKNKEIIEYVNFGFKNISYDTIKSYLCDKIFIQNEANLALLYEKHSRNITDDNLIVQLSINEGLGCGIYDKSTFLQSNLGYAGELGSIIIDYKTAETAEDLISYENIINSYNSTSKNKINSIDEYFEKLKQNEEQAVLLKDKIIMILNTAIHNINMILDPALVILNGKTIREFISLGILDSIKCSSTNIRNFTSQTELIFSDNINTTTYGAALYAISVIFGQHNR